MTLLLLQSGQFKDLLEVVDSAGRTPLHIAAFRSPEEVCLQLVEHGAQPLVKDKRANTPSELAGRMGRSSSKKYLLECEGGLTAALAATKLKRRMQKKAAQEKAQGGGKGDKQ